MSAALDVLMVVAARVLTELLRALATGSDAAHASVWAFEVTGDVLSAGEPGGHMSVRKITDDGGLLSAVNYNGFRDFRSEDAPVAQADHRSVRHLECQRP